MDADAPHKGHAVARLAKRWACTAVLYVGDEPTDEDVFRGPGAPEIIGVRIGRARTAAQYRIIDQRDIVHLLRALIRATPRR
jgi:trehalose-6-phosphatase